VRGLDSVREALWDVLGPLGTVRTQGAFYFLVPVPEGVSEQEAVHLLATKHKVLLMLGSPFGAPQHLRLSYGGLPPASALAAVERLRQGFVDIHELAEKRAKPSP
jgi:aspartate/methionine/tyrosine aminotransferase